MKKLFNVKNILNYFFIGLMLVLVSGITLTRADTNISGGNIFDGVNLTQNGTGWIDPVPANDGNEVQLRVRVVNLGGENASNVVVKADLSNAISPSVTISGDNFDNQTDIVSLTPGGNSLTLVPGSVKKYGPACENGCAVGDEIVSSGLNLGAVEPTSLKSFQITFKVNVVGNPTSGNRPVYRAGNIFDGGNRTDRLVDWQDPIPADPGELIEYRLLIANDGSATAENTTVQVAFPSTPSTTLITRATITGTSADPVSDVATVNVSGTIPQTITYAPGHTILWGPGCDNGCALPDGVTSRGVSLGRTIQVGQSYQLVFKAVLSGNQPTATPTVTPTATPTNNPESQCLDLVASTTDGTAPVTITFTGSGHDSAGNIQEYEFNFGDDSNGQARVVKTTGTQASHTYHNTGTYEISLQVRDSRGNWKGGNECKVSITSRKKPEVQGAKTPTKLPKTGASAFVLVSLPVIAGAAFFLNRKYRLV